MKHRHSILNFAAALLVGSSAALGCAYANQGSSVFDKPPEEEAGPIGPQLPEDAQTERLQSEELEDKLVGAWALVTTANAEMTNDAVKDAVKRCVTPMALRSLDIEPGAARKLPRPKDMFGDIVYYSSLKGLQRLSVKTGQIIRLPKTVRQQLSNGTVIWAVGGRVASFRIRFAKPSNTRRAEFMLEEGGVYLKCQLKDDAAASDQ